MAQEPQTLSKPNVVKEARQRQLIDATISTIGRVGYAGTTLTHVAGAAGMSPGIVNFYFKSKDQLLAATLAQLAEEYESFWMSAIAAAGGTPEAGLDAMVESDFHPNICTIDKIVVWFAFWAEAQSRPLYRSVVSELEERYFQTTRALCEQLIEKGGYSDIDAADAAHGINALSDGLWADMLINAEAFDHEAAKRICRKFLAAMFPRHFRAQGVIAGDSAPVMPMTRNAPQTAVVPATAHAHRARLAAALRRRMPADDLAARLGLDVAVVTDWLEQRSEPTSSQLGTLVATLDPSFIIELYGPEVEALQRQYNASLADAREAELRARAALDILRGGSK